MPDIRPFRGLRYPADADLPLAVAPPYDVIDDAERARLAAQPHNTVNLILPQPGPAGDKYQQAAATLREWRDGGALTLDSEPAFYIYAQTFAFLGGTPVTRAGVMGAVKHAPSIAGHERTHQGPKDDRFALMSACQANLSPIFSLAEDADGALNDAVTAAMQDAPTADFTDDAGVRHQLWVDTDPARADAIGGALRDTNMVIADGHHRYETSVTYREDVGGPGSDAVMMMCVSLKSEGLRIYPYHRVLTEMPPGGLPTPAAPPTGWSVETLAANAWSDVEQRLTAPTKTHHAFALYTKDGCVLLSRPRDAAADDMDGLDANVLQHELFEHAWSLDVEHLNHHGGLTYTPDGTEAMGRVDRGDAAMAVLVNATPTQSVLDCAAAGKRMPQKSTYFYPKLLTGLVFRSLPDDPA